MTRQETIGNRLAEMRPAIEQDHTYESVCERPKDGPNIVEWLELPADIYTEFDEALEAHNQMLEDVYLGEYR